MYVYVGWLLLMWGSCSLCRLGGEWWLRLLCVWVGMVGCDCLMWVCL